MTLSIIIPTLNEEKYLPKLMLSLHNQTFKDFEVVVADNHSRDETRVIAKKYGAKVVDGGWPSVGRNAGARVADGDLLLFLDADVYFANSFLRKATQSFNQEHLDLANVNYSHEGKLKFVSIVVNLFRNIQKNGIVSAQCLFIKKAVFEQLRGFNERMQIGEDIELGQRARLLGLKSGSVQGKVIVSNRRINKFGIINNLLRGFVLYLYWKYSPKKYMLNQTWAGNFYGGWNH